MGVIIFLVCAGLFFSLFIVPLAIWYSVSALRREQKEELAALQNRLTMILKEIGRRPNSIGTPLTPLATNSAAVRQSRGVDEDPSIRGVAETNKDLAPSSVPASILPTAISRDENSGRDAHDGLRLCTSYRLGGT